MRREKFEALKYAHGLGIPVPLAYEFSPETRTIWMEYVESDPLEEVWPKMSPDDKTSIAQQLRSIISKLRSERPENIFIGAINAVARDCRRFSDYTDGPFTNEASFNAFILDLYRPTPIPIRDSLGAALRSDHEIVFTHADLSLRNIIVRDGQIQGLVDWKFAGWYPEYWEYVKFFECCSSCKDWRNFAPTIFDTAYETELVTQQAIIRWQQP